MQILAMHTVAKDDWGWGEDGITTCVNEELSFSTARDIKRRAPAGKSVLAIIDFQSVGFQPILIGRCV